MLGTFYRTRSSAQHSLFRSMGSVYQNSRREFEKLGLKESDSKLIEDILSCIDINSVENFAVFSNDLYPNIITSNILLKYVGGDINKKLPDFKIVDGSFLGDMWFNNDDVPEEMRHKFVSHYSVLFVFMSEMSFSYRRFNSILKDVYSSREKDGKRTILIFRGNYSQYKENEGDLSFFDKVFEVNFPKGKKVVKSSVKNKSNNIGRIV